MMNETIILSNPKIIEFYQENPSLDPEQLNLIIIDLYNTLITKNNKITKNTSQEILHQIQSIRTTIESNQINILSKFYELKSTYQEELKYILENNSSSNILKLTDKIEKENEILLCKTTTLFHDIIPKSHSLYYQEYDNFIKSFKEEFTNHIESMKTDVSLDKIHILISKEYGNLITNIQNTISNYISNSEDRIRNHITDVRTHQNDQEKIHNEILTFLNLYKTPTKKGEISENVLHVLLTQLFPSAEIVHTAKQTSSGDCILKRIHKPTILFENKNYNTNVPKQEVEKFIYDIEQNNCSGIFMSQKTGISLKKNFEINIHKGNILVYIHNMNYDQEKILIAVDIIDQITERLQSYDSNTSITIPIETIDILRIQYQTFQEKKDRIINQLHENTKKLVQEIKDFTIPDLQAILQGSPTSHPIENNIVETFVCEICNKYTANNSKSFNIHHTFCKKKHNILN